MFVQTHFQRTRHHSSHNSSSSHNHNHSQTSSSLTGAAGNSSSSSSSSSQTANNHNSHRQNNQQLRISTKQQQNRINNKSNSKNSNLNQTKRLALVAKKANSSPLAPALQRQQTLLPADFNSSSKSFDVDVATAASTTADADLDAAPKWPRASLIATTTTTSNPTQVFGAIPQPKPSQEAFEPEKEIPGEGKGKGIGAGKGGRCEPPTQQKQRHRGQLRRSVDSFGCNRSFVSLRQNHSRSVESLELLYYPQPLTINKLNNEQLLLSSKYHQQVDSALIGSLPLPPINNNNNNNNNSKPQQSDDKYSNVNCEGRSLKRLALGATHRSLSAGSSSSSSNYTKANSSGFQTRRPFDAVWKRSLSAPTPAPAPAPAPIPAPATETRTRTGTGTAANGSSSRSSRSSRLTLFIGSRRHFELVSAFCVNFVAYQLETWRLLASGDGIVQTEAAAAVAVAAIGDAAANDTQTSAYTNIQPQSDSIKWSPPTQQSSSSSSLSNHHNVRQPQRRQLSIEQERSSFLLKDQDQDKKQDNAMGPTQVPFQVSAGHYYYSTNGCQVSPSSSTSFSSASKMLFAQQKCHRGLQPYNHNNTPLTQSNCYKNYFVTSEKSNTTQQQQQQTVQLVGGASEAAAAVAGDNNNQRQQLSKFPSYQRSLFQRQDSFVANDYIRGGGVDYQPPPSSTSSAAANHQHRNQHRHRSSTCPSVNSVNTSSPPPTDIDIATATATAIERHWPIRNTSTITIKSLSQEPSIEDDKFRHKYHHAAPVALKSDLEESEFFRESFAGGNNFSQQQQQQQQQQHTISHHLQQKHRQLTGGSLPAGIIAHKQANSRQLSLNQPESFGQFSFDEPNSLPLTRNVNDNQQQLRQRQNHFASKPPQSMLFGGGNQHQHQTGDCDASYVNSHLLLPEQQQQQQQQQQRATQRSHFFPPFATSSVDYHHYHNHNHRHNHHNQQQYSLANNNTRAAAAATTNSIRGQPLTVGSDSELYSKYRSQQYGSSLYQVSHKQQHRAAIPFYIHTQNEQQWQQEQEHQKQQLDFSGESIEISHSHAAAAAAAAAGIQSSPTSRVAVQSSCVAFATSDATANDEENDRSKQQQRQVRSAQLATTEQANSVGRNTSPSPKPSKMLTINNAAAAVTLSTTTKKSFSPGKLSLAGAKKRLGFKQKGLSSLSVQRSEEILPLDAGHLVRQMTANSLTDSGNESGSYWMSQSQTPHSSGSPDPRACFVEGLGAGQIASRQALVSPYLGDIQLSLSDRRGMLEVEVVRARRLQAKADAKTLPSPYVKVYLMKNKKCIAKCKTSTVRRTLDPLYQQQFIFREDYTDCVLQAIVWGDYGKKDRKSLMGIVQIHLNDLDISNLVIGWYKLFNAPSMASSVVSSKALRHTMLNRHASERLHSLGCSSG